MSSLKLGSTLGSFKNNLQTIDYRYVISVVFCIRKSVNQFKLWLKNEAGMIK